MTSTAFDILIIGSGPGGYVAAIRAAQLGFKVGVVERKHLGGICLNWGCIPAKALLRSAEIYRYIKHAKDYGLTAESIAVNPGAVVERSRAISRRLASGVAGLLKKNRVSVIWGEATLSKPGEVIVTASPKTPMQPQSAMTQDALGPGTYQAKHIVVATGARPRVLPGLEPDGNLVWTYFEALVPSAIPESLLVVGSGAIGIEFASFYNTMGADVTVIELLDQIMPLEDAEIANIAQKQLEHQGIKIRLFAEKSG